MVDITTRPNNRWTTKTMRSFLEAFAKSRNVDPLNPDTWYSFSLKSIYNNKVFFCCLRFIYLLKLYTGLYFVLTLCRTET